MTPCPTCGHEVTGHSAAYYVIVCGVAGCRCIDWHKVVRTNGEAELMALQRGWEFCRIDTGLRFAGGAPT